MPILYDRTETEHEVIIWYNSLPILSVISIAVTLAVLFAALNDHPLAGIATIAISFPIRFLWSKPRKEVDEANLRGAVMVSGSKWWFKSPLTITIPKGQEQHVQQAHGELRGILRLHTGLDDFRCGK